MLTQEYLKSILDYDPLTGVFTWKERPICDFNCERLRNGWNTKYSFKDAGRIKSDGYVQIGINRKRYAAHRLAWLYIYGEWPKNEIDHINGFRNDNRLSNIRESTRSENMQNKKTSHKNNKCKYLGVYFCNRSKRFVSIIALNNKTKYIGKFNDPESAHDAYLKAKRELHEFCTI